MFSQKTKPCWLAGLC